MKSPHSLRFSKPIKPSSFSFSSQKRCSSPLSIFTTLKRGECKHDLPLPQVLCSEVSHIWGNCRDQHSWCARGKPYPGIPPAWSQCLPSQVKWINKFESMLSFARLSVTQNTVLQWEKDLSFCLVLKWCSTYFNYPLSNNKSKERKTPWVVAQIY